MLVKCVLAECGGHEELYGTCLLIQASDIDDARRIFDHWAANYYPGRDFFGSGASHRKATPEQIWESRKILTDNCFEVDTVYTGFGEVE